MLKLTTYQNLGSLFDEPFGNLDAFAPADMGFPPNNVLPENVQFALDMVEDYKRSTTVNETSALNSHPQQWFSECPDLERYDASITNVFLNLAVKNLGPTFSCLENFTVTGATRPELYMAVAAVGGLFCQVSGSYSVAEAMFHDSRRLLLSAVSSPSQ